NFHLERGEGAYRDAFLTAGLDVEALPAREAGERLRATTVAAELAAALDDWALTRFAIHGPGDAVWKHLLQAAREADPDPWRGQLREALERRDGQAIRELAASEQVFRLLPVTLLVVGKSLGTVAPQRGLALLREAQRRHPDDFWANEDLGLTLMSLKPPEP